MSDILILMRHGKAQKPEANMADQERKLTKAGKRSLAATLPRALAQIPEGASMRIWSSPAKRALQTARIAARACDQRSIDCGKDIELAESLWTQDHDAFLADVRACEAPAVLAVGHNPFIEDAVEQLTGSRIFFATGGLAAIRLASASDIAENAPSGRLLWFVQGPMSRDWKSLAQVERAIADAAHEMNGRRDAFLGKPDDVETMHKLRVSIRTLRSLVAFVAPWQKRKQNKRVQADLKALAAPTSHLRELDVFTEQAASMQGVSPEFAAFCAKAASKERRKALKVLASKGMARRLRRAVEQLEHMEWRAEVRNGGLRASEVRARFEALASALEIELATFDLTDAEATHTVRKNAKRVRYDAERFGFLIGDDAVGIAKDMVAHQDNLGAICDARANIAITSALARNNPPESIARDLATLREQNEAFLRQVL